MSSYLITDTGDVRRADSPSLRVELGCENADFDFNAYAIRNLGFIEYRRFGTACRMRLRPRVANEAAVSAACFLLADTGPDRVALSYVGNPDEDELIPDWRLAVERLTQRVAKEQVGAPEALLRRTLDVDSMPQDDPLARLLAVWRSGGLRLDGPPVDTFHATLGTIGAPFVKRHILVEPDVDRRGTPLILSVGNGFPSTDVSILREAPRMSNHIDYAYGIWTEGFYRDLFADPKVSYDEVDAYIGLADHRRRTTYRRLILPLAAPGGSRRLLGVSVTDPNVDLREAVAA